MYLSRSESAHDSHPLLIGHQSMAAQATCLTNTHTPVNIFVFISFFQKRSFLRSIGQKRKDSYFGSGQI
jgi:hypothetical protein